MKAITILSAIFLLFFSACKKEDKNTLVEQGQIEVPVLKSKKTNHVLYLDIIKKDATAATRLKQVHISLDGTTDVSTIASVTLYYNPGKKAFLNEESIQFAKTKNVLSTITLNGDIELTKEHNYFWLSLTLKEDADIMGRIVAECIKVETDQGDAFVGKLAHPKKLRTGIAVRKHMDDKVHTYRIPGLVTTNKGTLLAVYDVRRDSSRDLQGDMDIGLSRTTDGGTTWEAMRIPLNMGEWGGLPQKFNGVSDASLLVDKNSGAIFVTGPWMHGVINAEGKWLENLTKDSIAWNHQWRNRGSQPGFGVNETAQFLIAKSSDDGKTWSEPINLTEMCKKEAWWLWAPAPGNGITLKDGTLVLPTQGRDKNGLPFSNITYSKDSGKTWKTSNPAYSNTTECAVVELDNGVLMLNMRDNTNEKEKGATNGRAIAITTNLGDTWTEHATSHGALQEPVCMASLYKHEYTVDGKKQSVLLFSNPNTKQGRYNITIKASLDQGKTWPEKYWLLLDEGYGRGYSSLTSVDEQTIGIFYESSQADMAFQKIELKELLHQ